MAIISDGTTIADAASFSVGLGNMVLLNTATASSSASLSFNSTYINSTYPIYKFEFIDIHPATNSAYFQVNLSIDSGSNYNVTKTTTYFHAYNNEAGDANALNYDPARDLAQSTSYQDISYQTGNDNDQSTSGNLFLFNPSSTTFIKHFLINIHSYSDVSGTDYSINTYVGGYGNTTSAVNAINFKFSSGNIDAGQIKLYGIKGS